MPSQLTLYNGALAVLGERKLASLTENREPRHKLDDIWARDFLRRVLQKGQWNFATRSIKPGVSASVTPAFGYENAFEKPSDFIRTTGVCQDEYFRTPLTDYTDETNYWFADLDEIYCRYISDDDQYGKDLSIWPPNFTTYVELELAYLVAPRLVGLDYDEDRLEKLRDKALKEAKATDAMEQPATFPPEGSWAGARRGRHSRNDRGRRSTLIG